jgi:hypothetical protein
MIALLLVLLAAAACGSGAKPAAKSEEPAAAPETAAEAPAERQAAADEGLIAMYERAKKDVTRLGIAIEAYRLDVGQFPAAQTVRELAALPGFAPDYIREVPLADPWGNEYLYEYTPFGFSVGCGGSDGVFGGFEQAGEIDLEPGVDIIYKNSGLSLNPQEKVNWN